MKSKLELVNFNLTHDMAEELIKFNNLKKDLLKLKNKKVLTNEEIKKIIELENELNKIRINFIRQFRQNNKEEIIKYLQIKDQI